MSAITTHVLDLAAGRPAAGVEVTLWRQREGTFENLGRGTTDADGRIDELLPPDRELVAGTYRLTFATGRYFERRETPTFYPRVDVTFTVAEPGQHYHVPLLLSPFGHSTYRGS